MISWEEEFKNILSELNVNLESKVFFYLIGSEQVDALGKEDEKKLSICILIQKRE